MTTPLRVAVVLASAGRPELLAEIVGSVRAQVGATFSTVVSVPDADSLPRGSAVLEDVAVVTGTRGLAAQRNAGLAALDHPQVVVFFDDDSVPREDWIATAVDTFEAHPEIVGITGRVLLDGAVTGEIPRPQAAAALRDSRAVPPTGRWRPTEELYGCNFAIRVDRAPGMSFDERLPLYSWLEDHDFARRLMRVGTLAVVEDCVVVHRAASSGGRQSHLRLGYSQVMNPMYLWRKGSFPFWFAVRHLARRVAKNLALSVGGPHRSGRRLRLWGNLLAASDLLRGRVTPERIVEL